MEQTPFRPDLKILLIEDVAITRKAEEAMLAKLGYTNVFSAQDGAAAWELLNNHHKSRRPFELVISDWSMPEMSGLELLKKCRSDERFEKLPFLMVTARGEKGSVQAAAKFGVTNYIVKPVSPETLQEKINRIFGLAGDGMDKTDG